MNVFDNKDKDQPYHDKYRQIITVVYMNLTVTALLVIALLVIKCILKPIMRRAGEENQDFYSGLYKWIVDHHPSGCGKLVRINKLKLHLLLEKQEI